MEENKNNREIDLIEILAFIISKIKKYKIFIIIFVLLATSYGFYRAKNIKDSYQTRSLCSKNLIDNDFLFSITYSLQESINDGQYEDLATLLKVPVNVICNIKSIKVDTFKGSNYAVFKISGSNLRDIDKTQNAVYEYFDMIFGKDIELKIKHNKEFVMQLQKMLSIIDNNYKQKNIESGICQKPLLEEYLKLNDKKLSLEKEIFILESDGAINEINKYSNRISPPGILKNTLRYFIVSLVLGIVLVILFESIIIINKRINLSK